MNLMEPDFGGSDRESDNDEDEVANIPAEESDYTSSSEDEGDSDSHDDQNDDLVADNGTESSDEGGEVRGRSKTEKAFQNVRGILSFMMWNLEVSLFLHHHSTIKPPISTSNSFLMTI